MPASRLCNSRTSCRSWSAELTESDDRMRERSFLSDRELGEDLAIVLGGLVALKLHHALVRALAAQLTRRSEVPSAGLALPALGHTLQVAERRQRHAPTELRSGVDQ